MNKPTFSPKREASFIVDSSQSGQLVAFLKTKHISIVHVEEAGDDFSEIEVRDVDESEGNSLLEEYRVKFTRESR